MNLFFVIHFVITGIFCHLFLTYYFRSKKHLKRMIELSDLVQLQNPKSKYWVLIDKNKGRIIGRSEDEFNGVNKPKTN